MRLMKGSRVEVLSKKELWVGAWYCAEIISGNGRSYYVKYGWLPGNDIGEVERVPRKLIRPSPPQVLGVDQWVPGDIIEVFHNLSWKTARVVSIEGGNSYIVRLIGSIEELKAHKSNLRVRQAWEDDKWFVLGKGARYCTTPEREKLAGAKNGECEHNSCFTLENNKMHKPLAGSRRVVVREMESPLVSSGLHAYHAGSRKRRLVNKDVEDWHPHGHHYTLEKIDMLVFPNRILGRNGIVSSSNKRRAEFSEVDIQGSMDNFHQRTLRRTATDSCASSVGSCSTDDCGMASSFMSHLDTDSAGEFSDAESGCGRAYTKEAYCQRRRRKLVAGARSSGLHAYRHAIEALFASGPISWEDEMHMLNLRQHHKVSNDEHLMLVRTLVSTETRHLSVDIKG